MSIQSDITARLVAQGVGTFGGDLFWGVMPEDPIEVTAVYETPGPGGLYSKNGAANSEGRLQVLVRSDDYTVAMDQALQAYNALDNARFTTGGTRYAIRAIQRPFDVGAQDLQGHTIISCNYAVTLWPV